MYGIGIVVLRLNNEKKVPFATIGGFDGALWSMCKGDGEKIRKINEVFLKEIDKEDLIDFKRLTLAPCDTVIVITGEETYEPLKGHNPIDCSQGSLNEKINLFDYLYGKVEPKVAGTETGKQ